MARANATWGEERIARVTAASILAGLHHEYRLERLAA
jgi:hypothetical protein